MQTEERKAFETILRELFGAIDKPLGESTIEGFWKGLAKMTLLEFSRCRDLLMGDFEQGEAPRKFGVPDIWAAKKRLRAAGPPKEIVPGWRGDDVDISANYRLMSVVMRAALARRAYSETQIRALVAFKNHWAEFVRSASGLSVAEQGEAWNEGLREALAQVEDERRAA